METNFQKIKQIIEASTLSFADQDRFLIALLRVSDEELAPALSLLQEDVIWVDNLFDNFKKKETATTNDNTYMWEDVMKEEEMTIKQAE